MTALHRAWINEQADKAKRDQGFHPLYWQYDQATQGWWLMRKRNAMGADKIYGPFHEAEAKLAGALHGVPFGEKHD